MFRVGNVTIWRNFLFAIRRLDKQITEQLSYCVFIAEYASKVGEIDIVAVFDLKRIEHFSSLGLFTRELSDLRLSVKLMYFAGYFPVALGAKDGLSAKASH